MITPVTVTVHGDDLVTSQQEVHQQLLDDDVAAKLLAHDATVCGAPRKRRRPSGWAGWMSSRSRGRCSPGSPRSVTPCARRASTASSCVGMGGSSLAPEVICRSAGVPLTVLDSTHPDQVQAALDGDLARTVVVVSSKSGGTLETDSQRRVLAAAFTAAGIDAASRIVVVTDPGSPFAQLAKDEGYREVFLADPHVGGRYSALTAFGLVPSALAGVDVGVLLDEAEEVLAGLGGDSPALELGSSLGGGARLGRDKLVLDASGSEHVGFGDWAEQLVAESTGKQGPGCCPSSSAATHLRSTRRPTICTWSGSVTVTSRSAPRSRAASAPSSWSGSTPWPSPGGSWASTRSTSPTSRAPRRPPAGCSTPSPSRSSLPSPTAASRSSAPLGCSSASASWPARSRPCWRRSSRAATSRSWPTSTGSGRGPC